MVALSVLTKNRRSTALTAFRPPPMPRAHHSNEALFSSLLGRTSALSSRGGVVALTRPAAPEDI